jgi:hypothetical protein
MQFFLVHKKSPQFTRHTASAFSEVKKGNEAGKYPVTWDKVSGIKDLPLLTFSTRQIFNQFLPINLHRNSGIT